MKLFVDTATKDFFVGLLDESFNLLNYFLKPNLIKKTELLPSVVKEILQERKIASQEIKAIYTLVGPGSFVGARSGLVFCKTMAKILKVPLLISDTLSFIGQFEPGIYHIDAKSGKSYQGQIQNDITKIELVPFSPSTNFNYQFFINNPQKFLKKFKLVSCLETLEAIYIKDPQIGGLK